MVQSMSIFIGTKYFNRFNIHIYIEMSIKQKFLFFYSVHKNNIIT